MACLRNTCKFLTQQKARILASFFKTIVARLIVLAAAAPKQRQRQQQHMDNLTRKCVSLFQHGQATSCATRWRPMTNATALLYLKTIRSEWCCRYSRRLRLKTQRNQSHKNLFTCASHISSAESSQNKSATYLKNLNAAFTCVLAGDMSTTSKLLKPPAQEETEVYSDDVLHGARREALKLIEFAKANNNPDCIVRTSKDTIVDKRQQWNIKHLIGTDKRLKTMAETLKATYALPIQRFCWPQIHRSPFPFVCIAPKSSGKTFAHLFYIITQCISDIPMTETNEIIENPEQPTSFVCDIGLPSSATIDMSNIDPDEIEFGSPEERPATASTGGSAQQNKLEQQANREEGLRNMGYTDIQPFEINPDDFIEHPKYIVICSSQNHVETIGREIERMKSAAFGNKIFVERRNKLPPKVAIIHVHQTDEKLAIKFNGCEVLITTPGALHKCIKLDLVDFTKCRRVFFDDIDLSLQLHNASIREIVKLYVVQMHDLEQQQPATENGYGNEKALATCTINMFSRKWTDLLKQSIHTVFRQHVLIFGSIAEASIYGNLRYEMEYVKSDDLAMHKLRALVERYECTRKPNDIMAITCKTSAEAKLILSKLDNTDQNKAVVLETDSISNLKLAGRSHKGPVYIISDKTLEFIIDDLNSVTHLVHFTLPEEHIIYDQRYRLMYRHIISTDSIDITTTVFVRPETSNEFVKELYDVLSRSSTTLRSTKLELRDLISEKSNEICWRWASTGLCRLEKLSKDDRFGSFCPNRHSFMPLDSWPPVERWPKSGQVKLTVTHLVNPNDFYFWFEAYRNLDSPMKKWKKFARSGTAFMQSMQVKLDEFKNTPPNSVPLKKINQHQVYGVYFQQESRVDRVVLLEKLNFDHVDPVKAFGGNIDSIPFLIKQRYNVEYMKQVEALKIDYGSKVNVYLRNIFVLPDSLASIERQCYRGFHLGVKPTDNEPDWLYKAKKNFYELVCVDNLQDVTAWVRTQNAGCFWFDNMVVSRELPEIGSRATFRTFPHEELVKKDLAVKCTSEPPCLPASDRLETICKWDIDNAARYASWAFLRKDRDSNDIYLLHVIGRTFLEMKVRLASYNKQLIDLEAKIRQDYEDNRLQVLNHFDVGVLCIVRLNFGVESESGMPCYEFNRCRIEQIISSQTVLQDPDSVDAGAKLDDIKFKIDCLDHGEVYTATKSNLFLAKVDYFKTLPFQAISCKFADLNPEVLVDSEQVRTIKEHFYDLTRTETEQMKILKCRLKDQQNELYIYVPLDEQGTTYVPLILLFEQLGIAICSNASSELRQMVEFKRADDGAEDEENIIESESEYAMKFLISSILDDIITKELGIEREEEEKMDGIGQEFRESLMDGFSGISIN